MVMNFRPLSLTSTIAPEYTSVAHFLNTVLLRFLYPVHVNPCTYRYLAFSSIVSIPHTARILTFIVRIFANFLSWNVCKVPKYSWTSETPTFSPRQKQNPDPEKIPENEWNLNSQKFANNLESGLTQILGYYYITLAIAKNLDCRPFKKVQKRMHFLRHFRSGQPNGSEL